MDMSVVALSVPTGHNSHAAGGPAAAASGNVTHDAGDPEDPTRICEPSHARTGMATTGNNSPAGGSLAACCGPGADDGGGEQMSCRRAR